MTMVKRIFKPTNLSWTRQAVIENLISDIEMLVDFEEEGSGDDDGVEYHVPPEYKDIAPEEDNEHLFSDEFLQEYVNYWVKDWEENFGEYSEDLYDSLAIAQAFWVAKKLNFPTIKHNNP